MRFPGDAVLFDLDGTLVDTAVDLADALNRSLAALGRKTLGVEAVKGMIGGGLPNLVTKGLEATGGGLPEAQFNEVVKTTRADYDAHVADHSKPYPGVLDALKALQRRGSRMAVCTNKPNTASKKLLVALGLDPFFPVLVGGDSLPMKKPHPKVAQEALKRLGAEVDHAVLVGDSETDVKLARAAGVPVILVEGGYSERPIKTLGADLVVRTLAQLPSYLTNPHA